MTGGPSRRREDVISDDGVRDETLHGDEETGDVPGALPRWQRWGYSLADRLQSADLRRWLDALGEPLRRPPTPEFEAGIDVDGAAPTDDMDIHTPAEWHDWPEDPGPAGYEWPPDDEPPPPPPPPSASEPAPRVTPHRSDPPPADAPDGNRHEDLPAVDLDDENTGSATPLPSPPDRHEHRSSTMTSDNTHRGTAGPAVPETYYDASTPGSRREKLLDGARAAAEDARRESEGAEELRRQARAIENIPRLADQHEALTAEARRQETNAENRLTIAAQFREAADQQATAAA